MHYYIEVKQFKEEIQEGKSHADIVTNGKQKNRIRFIKQKTGYGYKTFIQCNHCGKRSTRLYLHDETYICRECYPSSIYRGIQNTTIGGVDYISYKMASFAERHDIALKQHPFHYYDYPKPKYKHWNRWCDNLAIMQALANLRFQTIFMQKIWNTEITESILKGKNVLLYLYDLQEIDELIINWETGIIK